MKWIECQKSLPTENGVYLVTLNYATTDFCYFDAEKKVFGWQGMVCDEVVAWMKLPEPFTQADNQII